MKQIEIDDELFAFIQQRAEPLIDDANSVLRRVVGLDRGRPTSPIDRASGGERAAQGSILSEREYWAPILLELAEGGGTGSAKEVTDAVGRRIQDSLTEKDLEQLKSGDIRWRARVQFARLRMKEDGLIDPDQPRGLWVLTAKGRKAAKAALAAQARG